MRIGVVADDVTGANDIGIMFTNSGCVTNVFSQLPGSSGFLEFSAYSSDVVVLDTNSRLDSEQEAYQKVFSAATLLKEAGCQQFFNKTCSVFRGNIGAEFDAMLDALQIDFAVVVLGFPKNGRVTRNGIHFVHGKLLAESDFRNDPIHPMRESDLAKILQSQTKRIVDRLGFEVINQGEEVLREAIHQKRSQCNYLILDVLDQEMLRVIASAVKNETILCGSSALGEELPHAWGFLSSPEFTQSGCVDPQKGILITGGSLTPQTSAQIEHMRSLKKDVFCLDTHPLFDEVEKHIYIAQLVDQLSKILNQGRDVIFHSPYEPHQVETVRRVGYRSGLSLVQVSRLVSKSLAIITQQVLKTSNQRGLIVAGGETSAAVCQELAAFGFRVIKEIEPGLPSCVSLTDPPYVLVLKSGSFGKTDFFETALQHVRNL